MHILALKVADKYIQNIIITPFLLMSLYRGISG